MVVRGRSRTSRVMVCLHIGRSGVGTTRSAFLLEIVTVSYVGGKCHGRGVSLNVIDYNMRNMLEMERVNAYGISDFTK